MRTIPGWTLYFAKCILIIFIFCSYNQIKAKDNIKCNWEKNYSKIKINKNKLNLSFIEEFIYFDNKIYIYRDSDIYEIKNKSYKKIITFNDDIKQINFNNYRNQVYITLDDKIIIADNNFKVLDTILIKNGTISFNKSNIFVLNFDDKQLIINKLDSHFNFLKIDTIKIDGYFSLSECNFLIDENFYIKIDGKVNVVNTNSKRCELLEFKSNSEINKILGIYKNYLLLLYYSTDKTKYGEPIPDIRLVNLINKKQIYINSKNIIKRLEIDTETDEGSDNIEYNTWIDKVIYKYDEIDNIMLGFVNTRQGIEIYNLEVKF